MYDDWQTLILQKKSTKYGFSRNSRLILKIAIWSKIQIIKILKQNRNADLINRLQNVPEFHAICNFVHES